MSDYKLGKKVVPEPLDIDLGDAYDEVQTQHGPMLRNRRTGRIEQTSITPKGPQYAPQPEPQIITTEQWDQMFGILKKQEEDGLPVAFWGTF